MSSKKLSSPSELGAYQNHQAYIRIFKYKPLNQYDHLLCIHGDRGQGTTGEVAYLVMSQASYEAIAQRYPLAEREAGLLRSDYFTVSSVSSELQQAEAQQEAPTE